MAWLEFGDHYVNTEHISVATLKATEAPLYSIILTMKDGTQLEVEKVMESTWVELRMNLWQGGNIPIGASA
jgi:hypothetical protein